LEEPGVEFGGNLIGKGGDFPEQIINIKIEVCEHLLILP
jgi:hypothetical protein